APSRPEAKPLSEAAEKVASTLEQRGASFLADIATDTGLPPAQVRQALWELARSASATNDTFDAVRRGEQADALPADAAAAAPFRALRRMATQRPQGRWSLLRWGRPGPEEVALAQCLLLLQRYGVVSRELAALDPWLLPWRVLYEVLSRLELSGEVRRGYF